MSIPKYDELMKPLLTLIHDGQVYKMKDLYIPLSELYHLTEEEIGQLLGSGRQTVFRNRVGWASTYLNKAGLVNKPQRGCIQITDEGLSVLKDNPVKIDMKYLSKYESFQEFSGMKEDISNTASDTSNADDASSPQDLTPDDKLSDAFKDINQALAADLLEEVMKVSSYTFEKMVIDLLNKMGYGTPEYGSHATVASGDDGIDGVIMEGKLGFSLIYMQAKKWNPSSTVGQPELQNFVGAIAGKHGDGLFVTTAKFSQKAKDYAEKHHIILIDGEKLCKLMIENDFCVSTKKILKIKALDMDMISEYQEE